jgi:hypothetical protein
MIVRQDGDRILVDRWDPEIDVSLDVIASAPETYLSVDGEWLIVTVNNGCALYRVIGPSRYKDAVRCRLENCVEPSLEPIKPKRAREDPPDPDA